MIIKFDNEILIKVIEIFQYHPRKLRVLDGNLTSLLPLYEFQARLNLFKSKKYENMPQVE